MTRLAGRLGIDRTTMTRNLSLAERRGLIKTKPGKDSRERLIEITTAGRELADHAFPRGRAHSRRQRRAMLMNLLALLACTYTQRRQTWHWISSAVRFHGRNCRNISVFTNALASRDRPASVWSPTAGLDGPATDALRQEPTSPARSTDYPLVGAMVVPPPIIVGIAAILSQRVRTTLLAVPTETLIGLNAMRVFGAFFLLLAAAGRLSGPFPYSAGWGDVITGLMAIPLAMRVARGAASLTHPRAGTYLPCSTSWPP